MAFRSRRQSYIAEEINLASSGGNFFCETGFQGVSKKKRRVVIGDQQIRGVRKEYLVSLNKKERKYKKEEKRSSFVKT